MDGFTQSLLSEDAGSILATATNWDELEIQEETESGSSITSKIQLPTQVRETHFRSLGLRWGKDCSVLEKSSNSQLLRRS